MSDRRSRWFPQGDATVAMSYYRHMLDEDVRDQVVPYSSTRDAYVLTTEGAHRRDVADALRLGPDISGLEGFVREIASNLLVGKEMWLEVWFKDDETTPAGFGVSVAWGVTRKRDGRLVQTLPSASDVPDWLVDDGEWGNAVTLDDSRMVRVQPPTAYPSHIVQRVTDDLAEVRSDLMPDWVAATMRGDRTDTPYFDVAEVGRTERLRVGQITRPIGWSAREWIFAGPSSRTMSEYYRRWRDLWFLHFLASLREQAETALQRILILAGAHCQFEASVTVRNVCTPDEALEFLRRFEAGDMTFATADEIIRQKPEAIQTGSRCVV